MSVEELTATLCAEIAALPLDKKVSALNSVRLALHKLSPFNKEPVDCVLWVKGNSVTANEYNPNAVAPPEMRLLETSIQADGYTQPIVSGPAERGFVRGHFRNQRSC